MARSVKWSKSAVKDLERAIEYIYEDSPTYATVFYSSVKEKAISLKQFSERGRVVPELKDQSIREIFIHRYRLIYKISEHQVVILTLVHGAREFKQTDLDPQ